MKEMNERQRRGRDIIRKYFLAGLVIGFLVSSTVYLFIFMARF